MKITFEITNPDELVELHELIQTFIISKKKARNFLLADLPLTQRAINCLNSAGVYDMDSLLEYSERTLLLIPNLGRKSVGEIKEYLATINLRLKRS